MTLKKQIMVVEDNDLNREMLVEILSDRYSVLEAENGREALELLEAHGDDVALILLDVMMPVMDGFTFLDRIKSDEKLSLIPVIVMTQSDNESDEVEALIHGAADFVPKPYRPQVILHRVASIIKLRETAAMVNQFKYDRLTGLYSKEFFYQKVRECLQEDPDGEYSIVCSNIENFKMYNDVYGVSAGDRLLREIADKVRSLPEESGFCGRFGADRFLYMQKRGKEICRQGNMDGNSNEGHPDSGRVVIKWGIYEITDRSVPVEQMCDRAFLAVDSINGQYHQRMAIYDDTLRALLLRKQTITESAEAALKEGQFTVYFQPKYSLHTDRLAGAEALVRWNHPELGPVSPAEFIPLFEKSGFIIRLDLYVWEQVLRCLKEWKEKGYPKVPVSVNISRVDIYRKDLPEILPELVKKYGVKPSQLHLELTESAYAENPNEIIAAVEKLRKLGFVVEMDDFGSGYSSLNMLNQMKLDVLKLDMKFIQNETSKPAEQGILQFIISLARWLNMSVVAEGVETRAQLDRLREVGCDYVQGYFFAKPMPGCMFEDILRSGDPEAFEPAGARNREIGEMQNILVVDEDPDYRERVRKEFEGQYRVREAADAQSALAILRDRGDGLAAIVILSMCLPDKGAERVLSALRQDPVLWHIPVLATLSGETISEDLIWDPGTDDFLCKRHPMFDLKRRVGRMLSMAASRERERLLQDEACRDYLTGLLNRRGFYTAMEAMRQEDLPLALYLFDLDDLKKVNDKNGHEAGDAMLQAFGDLLKRHTRDGDILCRYGGDEFLVILRRISSVETITKKCMDICRDFHEFILPDGTSAACSCGIALCGNDDKPSAEMIEHADKALYRAKREYKGGCCLWEG